MTINSIQSSEPINGTFRLVARLVVDDIANGKRIFEASSVKEVDQFTIELQASWCNSVVTLKDSAGQPLEHETFNAAFSDDASKITERIMEYCSSPWFDGNDALPNYEDTLLGGAGKELDSICEYFSISTEDILRLLFDYEGIEIDSVTIDADLIADADRFKSGEFSKEEFIEALEAYVGSCPMFEVELHLVMKSYLDHEHFLGRVVEQFWENVPGWDDLEDAEYEKLERVCAAFITSLKQSLGPV